MGDPEFYTTAASLLPRLLGLIYFFAIGALLFQVRGLLGRNGILPVHDYLESIRLYFNSPKRLLYIPSIFWIHSSDRTLLGVITIGIVVSFVLMLGYQSSLCLGLLFVIYLSITSVGQDFLSFGWESFLLEITFYTFWMSLTPIPQLMLWINLNFLLFRFHIQAGAVKLQSHDYAWRDLTALAFHYQTQPLPNTWAWYIYRCPMAFHKASTLVMYFIELIIPFGLFFNAEMRTAVGIAFIALQVIIWLTGNFSYLNHLTAAFSIITFPNDALSFLKQPLILSNSIHWLAELLLASMGIGFFALQSARLWNHFFPKRSLLTRWLEWLSPFRLVNRYGLFAIMTKKRYEIVIEGSEDGETWKEYLFWYKPSEITRRPRRISPYQPRLDWQMWFLPFDNFQSATWFHSFLYHLLKGNSVVLQLLRHNPFPHQPPLYLRTLMYDYQFSTREQKKELGWWWQRDFVGFFSPKMTLKNTIQKN